MGNDETAEDKEPKEVKRPRGRRLGVRQMENVYIPEFTSIFMKLGDLLRKRAEAKRLEIREIVKESLGIQEVVEAATSVAKKAKEKFAEANRIHEEAEALQEQSLEIANASKIITLELNKKSRSYSSHYGRDDYETVSGIDVEFTDEFKKIIEASMLLQREHLDLEYLEYQRKDLFSKLRKSITMEEAVSVLGEAQTMMDSLEKEHRKLLEVQEKRNVKLERVRAKREDDIT